MGQKTLFQTRDDESSLESHCFRKSIAAACVRFEDWVSSRIVVRAGFARIVTSPVPVRWPECPGDKPTFGTRSS